jgi:hypothetical protein
MFKAIFFLEAIVVTRYAFVHLVRNPVALNDDFFRLFINVSTGTLSFISQIVYVWMPGRNPLGYYICTGKFPLSTIPLETPIKPNLPVVAVLVLSCCTHVYTALKLRQSKHRDENSKPKVVVDEKKSLKVFNVLTDKHMLASFTSNIISLGSLVAAYLIAYTFNKIEPQDLSKFPNYIFVYFWHHWMPQISFFGTIFVYYGRHQALKSAVLREMYELSFGIFQIGGQYSSMIDTKN